MNKQKVSSVIIYIILVLNGCKSAPESEEFYAEYITRQLTQEERSVVLSDKAARLYETMEKDMNFQMVPEIRELLKQSLYIHKNNTEAITLLKKVNEFKSVHFNKFYETSYKYYQRTDRTEQDSFNMCYFLQRALNVAPGHIKALQLKKLIKDETDKLITMYLEKGTVSDNALSGTLSEEDEDKFILQGIDSYGRILLIQPENETARLRKEKFILGIKSKMNALIDSTSQDIASGNYKPVNDKIIKLDKYNSSIDFEMKEEIIHLRYTVFYKQAGEYVKKNNLSLARRRINAALLYKKTPEAVGLQNRINALIIARGKTYSAKEGLTSGKTEINDLLSENELSLARDKISGLLHTAQSQAEKEELAGMQTTLSARIKTSLPVLYEEAVNLFTKEKYREAILKFQEVVNLNPDYEKSQDYLHKAMQRQAILDSL